MLLKLFVASALVTLISACSTTRGPATVEAECRIFGPLSSSVKDTKQTRLGILTHNKIGMAACHWKP